MKLAEDLKKAVLQAAMQGKLTKQLESDTSVDELLKKIADEKAKLIEEGKIKKEKPLAEIKKEEIPFDIPENWRWEKLGNVVRFINGRAYSADELLSKGKYKVLRVGNFFTNESWYYSDLELPEEKYCYNGDLLYAWSASFGPRIWNGNKTIFHYHIWNVDYNRDSLNRDFLYWYFEWDKNTIRKSTTGSTMIHVSMTNMVQRLLPLPPIEEQQRIVEKLNQILPLIDEYGKEEDELIALCQKFPEEMKKSVLQAAMQGKLTKQLETDSSVDELLKKIADEKAKLIKEGKIKKEKPLAEITEEEIPFEIPENWRWEKLGNIGSFLRGSGIKRTETIPEGFPCIRYGELYTTYKTSFSQIRSFVPKSIYDKAFKIEKNDICMALTGENKFDIALASVYQGELPIAMGGDMTRFRVIYGKPLYYVYAINSTYGINCKQKLATGDIICHISNDKLANIPFPLPPIEEQQRIVEKLNTILPIIDSMAVYGTKKKTGRPKQEEALAFISSLLGTQKSTDLKPAAPEITELKAKAKEELPAVVKKYASLMEVTYNRITIRHQKTRWGSCTKTGNLSFNCLLMKMPENVRDYVIIHELAHRKELNHSSKFWAIVAEYCPWYKDAKQWLKDNGNKLMEK